MTNKEINKLGVRIGNAKDITQEDLSQLQEYRKSFQEPLARVFSCILKEARKIDKKAIVTYRIKRIDTIIEKVKRFRNNPNGSMQLSRMWDIAGCRCILDTSDTNKLYELLQRIQLEYPDNVKINDYVLSPKESGYRSIHIYVQDEKTQKRIEIQLRNKNQHNWATLVEILDLLYEQTNKEQGAYGKFGKFLLLYSKASALNETEFREMVKFERRNRIFEKMSDVLTSNYLNIHRQWLKQKRDGCYFVITANKKKSEICSYQTFEEAEAAYFEKYRENSDSNIVLTHLQNPNFNQISMAYSNYVLALHTFFDDYRALLAKRIITCVQEKSYLQFFKYFKVYNRDVRCHLKNMVQEIRSIQTCMNDPMISRNQLNNWLKELKDTISLWADDTRKFLRELIDVSRDSGLNRWLIKNRTNRLSKVISIAVKGV